MDKHQSQHEISIGELATQSGVPASTIRYYEKIGLIPFAKRISGQRRFNTAVIKQLKLIRIAQKIGWSLNEIKSLVNANQLNESWRKQAPRKLQELDDLMAEIQQRKERILMGLQCNCIDFQDCVLLD